MGLDADGNIEAFDDGLVMGPNGPRAADPWEMDCGANLPRPPQYDPLTIRHHHSEESEP